MKTQRLAISVSAGTLLTLLISTLPTSAASPPNDAFAQRIHITESQASVTGSNVGASREAGEPQHNQTSQGKSVWWTWEAPDSGFLTASTSGSSFDTILAIYTGTALPDLTSVAWDDDGGGNYTSRTSFRVTRGLNYHIAVDGYPLTSGVDSGTIRLALDFATSLPAPAWRLRNLEGQWVSSTNFQNQVVVLNFWATWCGPCIAEMPSLVRLQDRYREQGLQIVGVSVDQQGVSVVRPFVADHGLNYVILMTDGKIESDFGGIEFIPTTFLIDREGNLIDKLVGYTEEGDFENRITPLLQPVTPLRAGITGRDGKVILSWPLEHANVRLESAESVLGPWTAFPVSAVVTNGHYEAELESGTEAGHSFLRLIR